MVTKLGSLQAFYHFHKNGTIKEKGFQGTIGNNSVNTKTSIGTWYYYDVSNHFRFNNIL
jgi:hypothetical protein